MWQKIRFFIERWKRRQIPFYLTVVGILILVFVPTGDLTDLITVPLIGMMGLRIFVAISVILLIIFLSNGKIRSLFMNPSIEESRSICRKITKTKKDFKHCVWSN